MSRKCLVPDCRPQPGEFLTFHRIPVDDYKRQIWLDQLDLPSTSTVRVKTQNINSGKSSSTEFKGKYKQSMNIRGKCNACCVPGCSSNSTPSFRNRGGRITTFKLPRDEGRRKEWIQAIPKRKYPPTVNHNVCILHFNEEDFSRNNRRIDLKKSAVPSIFPFVKGQPTDEEISDVCDEVWSQYEANRTESMNKPLDLNDDTFPSPITDLSRILIQRLRIPGSKYFGIDTAEIVVEPGSQYDSDSGVSEQNSTVHAKETRENNSSNEFQIQSHSQDDFVMKDSSDEFEQNFDEFRQAKSSIDESNDEHVEQVNSMISSQSNTLRNIDDEDKFGTMVGSKLLLMSPLQRLMSQKIISEILLKGQLNMLKNSSKPVLVSGYVKNTTNGTTSTISASLSDDDDPLMLEIKQEDASESRGIVALEVVELVDVVKDEVSWSN